MLHYTSFMPSLQASLGRGGTASAIACLSRSKAGTKALRANCSLFLVLPGAGVILLGLLGCALLSKVPHTCPGLQGL